MRYAYKYDNNTCAKAKLEVGLKMYDVAISKDPPFPSLIDVSSFI